MEQVPLELNPYELALGYVYKKVLEQGDLTTIETIELLILRDTPVTSYLRVLVMGNAAERMTPAALQATINEVVRSILGENHE